MSLAIYHDPYARGIPSLRGTSVKSPAETSSYQHLVPSPTIVPNICRWTPKSKQVSPTSTEHREKHFDHMDKQKNLAFPWSFANDCQFNVMSPVFLTSLFSLDVWCIMDLHVFAMNGTVRMPTWLPNAQPRRRRMALIVPLTGIGKCAMFMRRLASMKPCASCSFGSLKVNGSQLATIQFFCEWIVETGGKQTIKTLNIKFLLAALIRFKRNLQETRQGLHPRCKQDSLVLFNATRQPKIYGNVWF